MGTAFSNFDLDLKFGQLGEQYVSDVFTGDIKSEVKTDRRWVDTGNIYVETECYKNGSQKWEASGIYAPELEADLFVYNVEGMIVAMPVESMKYAVEAFGRPITCDIQPNPSKGVLLTLAQLASAHREWIKDNKNGN